MSAVNFANSHRRSSQPPESVAWSKTCFGHVQSADQSVRVSKAGNVSSASLPSKRIACDRLRNVIPRIRNDKKSALRSGSRYRGCRTWSIQSFVLASKGLDIPWRRLPAPHNFTGGSHLAEKTWPRIANLDYKQTLYNTNSSNLRAFYCAQCKYTLPRHSFTFRNA